MIHFFKKEDIDMNERYAESLSAVGSYGVFI